MVKKNIDNQDVFVDGNDNMEVPYITLDQIRSDPNVKKRIEDESIEEADPTIVGSFEELSEYMKKQIDEFGITFDKPENRNDFALFFTSLMMNIEKANVTYSEQDDGRMKFGPMIGSYYWSVDKTLEYIIAQIFSGAFVSSATAAIFKENQDVKKLMVGAGLCLTGDVILHLFQKEEFKFFGKMPEEAFCVIYCARRQARESKFSAESIYHQLTENPKFKTLGCPYISKFSKLYEGRCTKCDAKTGHCMITLDDVKKYLDEYGEKFQIEKAGWIDPEKTLEAYCTK